MYTSFQLISNLGEERFYYPSPTPLEPDEYLIWYVSDMLSTELGIRTPYGTFGGRNIPEERIRLKMAREHRQLISQHIFSVEPYSRSVEQITLTAYP